MTLLLITVGAFTILDTRGSLCFTRGERRHVRVWIWFITVVGSYVAGRVVKSLEYKIFAPTCVLRGRTYTLRFALAAHSGSENLISSQMGPSNDL